MDNNLSSARLVLFLTNLIVAFIEFVIGLRLILKILGANMQAPFVQWVYDTSGPLIAPFEGMFPTTRLTGNFIVEISALFALLIYIFIGYIIGEIVNYVQESATLRVISHKSRKKN